MPPRHLLRPAARILRQSPQSCRALSVLPHCTPSVNNQIRAAPAHRSVHSSSVVHDGEHEAAQKRMMEGKAAASFANPSARYEYLVEAGVLRDDDHQRKIVGRLTRMWEDLKDYDPGELPDKKSADVQPSFFGKFFSRTDAQLEPTVDADDVPKGLYLYGSVGTGKTMLMDLFYSTLPRQFQPGGKYGSTRIHFHSFMIDVLQMQHAVTAKYAAAGEPKRDALPEVARAIAEQGRVLCFDEFQVTDIVTAMLLRGLFERLTDFGVVSIITSNRHPDELYLNGIQRESFIPAIELIKERFNVVDLNSGTDYRKIPRTLTKVYYYPLNEETSSEMDKLFHAIASADVDPEIRVGRKLPLWGRELTVPESSGHVARFTFDDLCNHPLSAADYLEITGQFDTVFVEDMPKLTLSERDQARRFITFIDACYENKTKLFISSDGPIYQIFSSDGSASSAQDDAAMKEQLNELGIDSKIVGSSSLFSGDEELFAFARCVSRLTQMSSKEWADESALAHPQGKQKRKKE